MNRKTFAFIAVCIQLATLSVIHAKRAMADGPALARATLTLEAEVQARGPELILTDNNTTFDLDLASGRAEVSIPVQIRLSNTKGSLSVSRPESSELLPNLDLNLKDKESKHRLDLGGTVDLGVIGDGTILGLQRFAGSKPVIKEEIHISASYPAGADRPYGQTVQETLTVTFTAS